MDEKLRQDGIAAIIFLQKLAGIDEPRDKAERGWANMTTWEREVTLRMADQLKPREGDKS